jgi:hypothetical protein
MRTILTEMELRDSLSFYREKECLKEMVIRDSLSFYRNGY